MHTGLVYKMVLHKLTSFQERKQIQILNFCNCLLSYYFPSNLILNTSQSAYVFFVLEFFFQEVQYIYAILICRSVIDLNFDMLN